jgi:hypothetical protein
MNRHLILLICLLLFLPVQAVSQGGYVHSGKWAKYYDLEKRQDQADSQTAKKDERTDSGREHFLVQGNTKLWLEKNVSLRNTGHIVLNRAKDSTDNNLDALAIDTITAVIGDELGSMNLNVIAPEEKASSRGIRIKPVITKHEAGSAAQRWMAPGAGSTVCIVRATIFSSQNEVIGEIVSWRHVPSGGLFSVGAEKYVPVETAKALARVLAAEIQR